MEINYRCIRCGGLIVKGNAGTYVCTKCGLWCDESEGAGSIGIEKANNDKPNNSYESIMQKMYGNKGGQNGK